MRQKLLLLIVGVTVVVMLIAAVQLRSAPAPHPGRHRGTAVLELFTSQGCSSCPPADALLSKLGSESFVDGTVVPLAYHVDYWNSLGWSDPFSSSRWSKRQNDYARTLNLTQIYTPQLVVNGRAQLVGSSESGVRAEVKRELVRGDIGTVEIERLVRDGASAAVKVRAHLDRPAANDARVMVVLFENGATTAVSHGENAGRQLASDYIVRWQNSMSSIAKGSSDSEASIAIPLDPSWQPRNLGVAAFIQDAHSLEIYGAASKRLQ